jgi:hypothetical protein
MKFIAPLEIASKIMTLIVEAEIELILVSPYVKINDWDKMKKSLSKAVNKGVAITFIARQNTNDDLTPLKALNIKPILVKDLHAKVYINDKYAIVTSQNITQYSDINSIDIGYQTENEKERLELIDFVNNYITTINLKEEHSKRNVILKPEKTPQKEENLTSHELEKLNQFFWINFPLAKITKASNYIFCDYLLPFADVMISTQYVIKISKHNTDSDLIVQKIKSIRFESNNTFKIELRSSQNKSYYYLDFIPVGNLKIDDLIQDYFKITNSILKSNISIKS